MLNYAFGGTYATQGREQTHFEWARGANHNNRTGEDWPGTQGSRELEGKKNLWEEDQEDHVEAGMEPDSILCGRPGLSQHPHQGDFHEEKAHWMQAREKLHWSPRGADLADVESQDKERKKAWKEAVDMAHH